MPLTEAEMNEIREEAEKEWVDVPGYPGYKANKSGFLLGKSGLQMEGHKRENGYIEVRVVNNYGKLCNTKAHRLIAITFIPNPENKPFINHKNGIKTDNRVANLEWVTKAENNKHARDTGLRSKEMCLRGENHPRSKLSEKSAKEILKLKGKMKQMDIAKMFGIKEPTVSNLLAGRIWPHLQEPIPSPTTINH